ncbi:MAG: hypothetical protein WA160_09925 [Pseudobdellovibrio sp.]
MSLRSSKQASLAWSLVLFIFIIAACAPHVTVNSSYSKTQASTGLVNPPTADIVPTIPTSPIVKMEPLAWEKTVLNSPLWSAYIYSVISLEESQMLNSDAALDTDLFCPRFKQLNKSQRLNFWGQLIVGVAKFESGWDPTNRMIETSMGTDSITGQQIASEGLLQMSYQDVPNWNNICEFDWNFDKAFSIRNPRDPRKTILDPYKNLRCGIKIFAKLLKSKQLISFDDGAYWAVLRKTKRNHVSEIADYTKSLSFCVSPGRTN